MCARNETSFCVWELLAPYLHDGSDKTFVAAQNRQVCQRSLLGDMYRLESWHVLRARVLTYTASAVGLSATCQWS